MNDSPVGCQTRDDRGRSREHREPNLTGTDPQDEVTLVQRSFTQDRRHLPLAETTGNGSTVSFAYDDFGCITSRTVDSNPDKVVSYQYGKDGRLEKTANTETGTMERIRCDLAGREMSRETKDQSGSTVHAAYAAYDEAQNVSMHVEKLKSANGTLKSYKTRYVYDRDDRTAFGMLLPENPGVYSADPNYKDDAIQDKKIYKLETVVHYVIRDQLKAGRKIRVVKDISEATEDEFLVAMRITTITEDDVFEDKIDFDVHFALYSKFYEDDPIEDWSWADKKATQESRFGTLSTSEPWVVDIGRIKYTYDSEIVYFAVIGEWRSLG